MVIYENPCYYDESNNAPLHMLASSTSNIIDDNEECCLDMLYDNALDNGPALMILHVQQLLLAYVRI